MSRSRHRVRVVLLTSVFVVSSLAVAGSPAAAGAAPANDNWAGAAPVGSLPATKNGDSTNATTEPGEPRSLCNGDDATVWYKIRPASDMVLMVDTFGSSVDVGVSVWQGGSLGTLDEIACSHGSSGDPVQLQGRAAFRAKAGVRYYIQIDAQGPGETPGGPFTLHVKRVTPPANDQWRDATPISSFPFRAVVNNARATTQLGEPAEGTCSDMRATRWYRVRPSETMTLRADTFGTEIDTVLAVVTGGPALRDVDYVACDDDNSFQSQAVYQSSVTWIAEAGTTYWIQVGGYANETGPIDFRVQRVQRAAIDDRGFALIIPEVTSAPFEWTTTTRNATPEGAETTQSPCVFGDEDLYPQSIWFRYGTPSTDSLTVSISGDPGVEPVVLVYTGSSFETQTVIACTRNVADFKPVAGTTYFFQVAGEGGRSGPITFRLSPTS